MIIAFQTKNGILSTESWLELSGLNRRSTKFLVYSKEELSEYETSRPSSLPPFPNLAVSRELPGFIGEKNADDRWGVLFDLIECLIQRDLGYTTRDVRVAYNTLKGALLDPGTDKVVVIAHSQGGLVLSMALDNLLSDLPRECKISVPHLISPLPRPSLAPLQLNADLLAEVLGVGDF